MAIAPATADFIRAGLDIGLVTAGMPKVRGEEHGEYAEQAIKCMFGTSSWRMIA